MSPTNAARGSKILFAKYIMTTPISSALSVSIKSGGADVLTGGSVHTFDPSNLTITVDDLVFHLQFAADKEGQRIVPEPRPPKSLFLKVYNFDSPIGAGLIQPMVVGVYQGKDLYFTFSSYSLSGTKGRLVLYTFYTKEKEVL